MNVILKIHAITKGKFITTVFGTPLVAGMTIMTQGSELLIMLRCCAIPQPPCSAVLIRGGVMKHSDRQPALRSHHSFTHKSALLTVNVKLSLCLTTQATS
jgi:hypothetical protein